MPCEGSDWRRLYGRPSSTQIWWALAAGALSVLLALAVLRRLRKAVQPAPATRKLATLRSPRAPAGIGHQWFLWGRNSPDLFKLLTQWAEEHGPFYQIKLKRRSLVVSDLRAIQALLQQRPTVFSRSPCAKQVFAAEGLHGLLTATGDNWTRQRRVTTTAMSRPQVKALLPEVCDVADRLLDKWTAIAQHGQVISCAPDCRAFAVNTGALVLLGRDLDALRYSTQAAADVTTVSSHVAAQLARHRAVRLLRTLLRRDAAPAAAATRVRSYVQRAVGDCLLRLGKDEESSADVSADVEGDVAKDPEAETSSSDEEIEGGSDSEEDEEAEEGAGEDASFPCLLDSMLDQLDTAEDTTEQSAIFSQLVGTVKALLLTQADVTGAALTWLLYDVASHPAVQNRLRAELRSISTGSASSGRLAAKTRGRTRSAQPARQLDTVAEVTPEATATATATASGGTSSDAANEGASAAGSENSSSGGTGRTADTPTATAADVISGMADSLDSPAAAENTAVMTAIVATAAAAAAAAAVRAAAPREVTVSVETTVTVHSERASTTSTVTDDLLQLQEQGTDEASTTAAPTAAIEQRQQQQQLLLQPCGVVSDAPRTASATVSATRETEQPELTAGTAVDSDTAIASDEWADVMTGIASTEQSADTERPHMLPLNVCSQEVPAIAGDFPCNLMAPCVTAVTSDADTAEATATAAAATDSAPTVVIGTARMSDRDITATTDTTAAGTATDDKSGTIITTVHTAAEGDRVVYIPLSRMQYMADTTGTTAAATAADTTTAEDDSVAYRSPTRENLGAGPTTGAASRMSSSEESVYGDDNDDDAAKAASNSSSSVQSSGYSSDEGFQDSMQEEEQAEEGGASLQQGDSPPAADKIYVTDPTAAAAAASAVAAAATAEHPVPLREIVAAAVARDAAAVAATLRAATAATADTAGASAVDATAAATSTAAANTGARSSSDADTSAGEQKEEQPNDATVGSATTADTTDDTTANNTTAAAGEETMSDTQPDSTTAPANTVSTSTTASSEQQLTAAVSSVQHRTVINETVTKGTVTFKSTAVASSPAVTTTSASTDMAPSATVRDSVQQQPSTDSAEAGAEASQTLTWTQVNHWEYLDAVVKESLRLHYPGGDVIQLRAEMPAVVGDVEVPRGADVFLLTRVPARSEANFTRAHQFWPERWLIAEGDAPLQPLEVASTTEPTTATSSSSSSSGGAANKFNHDASASMPFGRGPAACPAQSLATVQLKVVLATLLQRFHIALKYGHPEPTEQYTLGIWPDSVETVLTNTDAVA